MMRKNNVAYDVKMQKIPSLFC